MSRGAKGVSGILNRTKFRVMAASFPCQELTCSQWLQLPGGEGPKQDRLTPCALLTHSQLWEFLYEDAERKPGSHICVLYSTWWAY